MFESGIIVQAFFWIWNIILVILFLCALALGYKHGARYVLSQIGKVLVHITLTAFGTYWLTKSFTLFSEEGFYCP